MSRALAPDVVLAGRYPAAVSAVDVANLITNGVMAVGTLAAVAVAVISTRHEAAARVRAEARAEAAERSRDAERRTADAERATREREAAARARTEQALLVAVWPEWHTDIVTGGGPIGHWKLKLGNFSRAPVFDLSVGATNEAGQVVAGAHLHALPPDTVKSADTEERDREAPPRAEVVFRDLAGLTWSRKHTGELDPIHTDLRDGRLGGAQVD